MIVYSLAQMELKDCRDRKVQRARPAHLDLLETAAPPVETERTVPPDLLDHPDRLDL